MDLEPKKLMFCLMTALSESDRLADDLEELHDSLESAGEMDGNFSLMKNEVKRMLTEFSEFAETQGKRPPYEEEGREKATKCFAAYIWVSRIHNSVNRYAPLLEVMDGITEFNDMINKTNEFQESNA